MNLAIDSKPLKNSIFETQDYSGLQLYGLLAQTLNESLVEWTFSSRELSYFLFLKNPNHSLFFIKGLKHLFDSFPLYRKTIFRALKSVEEFKSGIRLNLAFKQRGFEKNFYLPNWVAASGSNILGSLRQTQKTSDQWEIIDDQGECQHKVWLVNSPAENLRLSLNSTLDYSADTATPLGMSLGDTLAYDTGLWACLWFGEKLQIQEKSLHLHESLKKFRLEKGKALFESQLPQGAQIGNPVDSYEGGGELRLSIGYDTFSPNFEIACLVKRHLSEKGWTVNLKADSYYAPRYDCDAKILILRPIVGSNVHFLHSLLPLCKTRKSFNLVKSKILIYENGDSSENLDLEDLEAVSNAFHFLTKIPSLSFSQCKEVNPMIRNLLVKENFLQ